MNSNGTLKSVINNVVQGCLDVYADCPCAACGGSGSTCFTCSGCAGTLDVATCNGTNAQKWTFKNGHLMMSQNNNFCVDVDGASQANGTVIDVTNCNGTIAQVFLPLNYTVKANSDSTHCLDVCGNSTSVGAVLDNGSCNTTSAQWFEFEPLGAAYFHGALLAQHSDRWVGWDETNGDPAVLSSDTSPSNCYEAWEYNNSQNLVNSCTVNSNLDTCLEIGTNQSCGTYTSETGCNLFTNQSWNITLLDL